MNKATEVGLQELSEGLTYNRGLKKLGLQIQIGLEVLDPAVKTAVIDSMQQGDVCLWTPRDPEQLAKVGMGST
jgi:hypothetical protein